MNNQIDQVGEYLRGLQDDIVSALEAVDSQETFRVDDWERPGGGGGRSRVLTDDRGKPCCEPQSPDPRVSIEAWIRNQD